MREELLHVAKRFAVYALCLALLFADSSRIGSFAEEAGTTSGNNVSEETEAATEQLDAEKSTHVSITNTLNGAYTIVLEGEEDAFPTGYQYGLNVSGFDASNYAALIRSFEKQNKLQLTDTTGFELSVSAVYVEPVEETEETELETEETELETEETELETEETELETEETELETEETLIESVESKESEEAVVDVEPVDDGTHGNEAIAPAIEDAEPQNDALDEEAEVMSLSEENSVASEEGVIELLAETGTEPAIDNQTSFAGNVTVTIYSQEAFGQIGLYCITNSEIQEIEYGWVNEQGIQFTTNSLGKYIIATKDVSDEIYTLMGSATDGCTLMTEYKDNENAVKSFKATMFNYSGDALNGFTKEMYGVTDSKDIFAFNKGDGNISYNRNNAGSGAGVTKDCALTGIVQNSLNPATKEPIFNVNAAPIFSTANEWKNIYYNGALAKHTYENVDFPFLYENGYYVFDSANMSVLANKEFYSSDVLTGYQLFHNDAFDNLSLEEQAADISVTGTWGLTGFWPFAVKQNKKDVHFGMNLAVGFTMNETGKTADGEDIVYEFSGDDDVWVFIDDQLVLDNGGIHGKVTGTINFATGDVILSRQRALIKKEDGSYSLSKPRENATADRNLYDIFGKDYFSDSSSLHTLRIFYLERGDNEANCKMSFNLDAYAIEETESNVSVASSKTAKLVNWDDRTYVITIGARSTATVSRIVNGVVTQTVGEEVNGVTVTDVIDDRFQLTESEIERLESDGAKVTAPTDDYPYYIVTWSGQTLGYSVSEDTWVKEIYVIARDSYLGGNDVLTNVPGDSKLTYPDKDGNVLTDVLPKPKVNVKVMEDLAGAFDVIFKGESLEEYFTQEKLASFVTLDENGKVVAIGQYTDLRDVDVLAYQFTDEEGNAVLVDEIKTERPVKDTSYHFALTYAPKTEGTECVEEMTIVDDNGEEHFYRNDKESYLLEADYNVYLFVGEVTVTKEIDVKSANFTTGDPIFTFELSGNGETYYKSVRFTKDMVDSAVEGKATLKVTFSELHKGTYTLKELPSIRYELNDLKFTEVSVSPVTLEGTVNEGNIVVTTTGDGLQPQFTFMVPQYEEEELVKNQADRTLKGFATAVNKKVLDFYDSDTDIVINTFVIDEDGNLVEIVQDKLKGEKVRYQAQ